MTTLLFIFFQEFRNSLRPPASRTRMQMQKSGSRTSLNSTGQSYTQSHETPPRARAAVNKRNSAPPAQMNDTMNTTSQYTNVSLFLFLLNYNNLDKMWKWNSLHSKTCFTEALCNNFRLRSIVKHIHALGKAFETLKINILRFLTVP